MCRSAGDKDIMRTVFAEYTARAIICRSSDTGHDVDDNQIVAFLTKHGNPVLSMDRMLLYTK